MEAKINPTELGTKLQLQGLEIVDVLAPNGKIVLCAKEGLVLVPIDKVAIYVMGKVKKYPVEELKELQELKQTDRKNFEANAGNARRLKEIKNLKHSYERSQEMFASINKIGLGDSVNDIIVIIRHLFAVGKEVDVQSPVRHPSKLDGLLGTLKVLSTWAVLPDGMRYLSSINIIPKMETA